MDDASSGFSLNLEALLVSDTSQTQKPLQFSARYLKVLPSETNYLQTHLNSIQEFSEHNGMKVNKQKSKVIKFTRVTRQTFPLK